MDEWVEMEWYGRMDEWVRAQMYEQSAGRIVGGGDEYIHEWVNEWLDGSGENWTKMNWCGVRWL